MQNIDEYVKFILQGENSLKEMFHAREQIKQQASVGKMYYYTFSYPDLGWKQYNHYSINVVYDLTNKKYKELYDVIMNNMYTKESRLNAMFAFYIKMSNHMFHTWEQIENVRRNVFYNPNLQVVVYYPLQSLFPIEEPVKIYTGTEMIELQEKYQSMPFQHLFHIL